MYKKLFLFFMLVFSVAYAYKVCQPALQNPDNVIFNDRGDGRLNLYFLEAMHRYVFDDTWPQDVYWTFPFFTPQKKTMAFSDNLFALHLIYTPLRLIGFSFTKAYNYWIFITFILCFWSAYYASMYYTGNRFVSFLTGFLFAFGPPKFAFLTHFQLHQTFFFPLFLVAWDKFILDEKFSWKSIGTISLTALLFLLNMYSSIYIGYFTVLIAITYSLIWFVFKKNYSISFIALKLKSFAAFSCISLPFLYILFYPYYWVSKRFGIRSVREVAFYMSTFFDNFYPNPWNWFCNTILKMPTKFGDTGSFFITNILLIGMFYLVFKFIWIKKISNKHENKVVVTIYFSLVVLCSVFVVIVTKNVLYVLYLIFIFLLFFLIKNKVGFENRKINILFFSGLFVYLIANKFLHYINPVWFFYAKIIPGMSSIRVPVRISILVIFLISTSVFYLIVDNIKGIFKLFLSGLICLFVFLESFSMYSFCTMDLPSSHFYTEYLAKKEINEPILFLPFFPNAYGTMDLLIAQLYFNKKIVNGYSGLEPSWYSRLKKYFAENNYNDEFFQLLTKRTKTVIVDKNRISSEMYNSLHTLLIKNYHILSIYEDNGDSFVIYTNE